ncbi:hypothetical protein ScPMuIL_017307 [Solemya velum]
MRARKYRLEKTTMIVIAFTLLIAMTAATDWHGAPITNVDACDVIGNGWKQLDPAVSHSCYFFSGKEKTNEKAEGRCVIKGGQYGGHLVQINSQEENQMIANEINETHWIGARSVSGSWKWFGSDDEVTYNNWASDEPNDHNKDEDCVQIYSNGLWNDQRCNKHLRYICEANLEHYLGCFVDRQNPNRDLTLSLGFSQQRTPDECRLKCYDSGYIYAGLQWSKTCWCSNTFGKHGPAPESECNIPCTGDASLKCGGYFRNAIYTTGLYL